MRVPIPLAFAAAVVLATTAVLVFKFVPPGTVVAPPYVYPSTSFQVAEDSWAVYYVSAHYIEARAGAPAFWGIAEFVNTPVLVFNDTIPPGTTILIFYYSVLADRVHSLYFINDTNGVSYYHHAPMYTCDWYVYAGAPEHMPAKVYRRGNLVVIVPDFESVAKDWIAQPTTSGISWYGKDGREKARCSYLRTYNGTLGYSLFFNGTSRTFKLPNGRYVSMTARPFLIGTVRPTATTTVTITVS